MKYQEEKWTAIPWAYHYDVSDHGNIRSRWWDPTGRILSPPTHSGYKRLQVRDRDGRLRDCYVHRLVMEVLVGRCPKGWQVNHIDGEKTNNRIENLEYVTPSANMRHASRLGLLKRRELTDGDVRAVRLALEKGVSSADIAREHGVSRRAIVFIQNRETWSWVS